MRLWLAPLRAHIRGGGPRIDLRDLRRRSAPHAPRLLRAGLERRRDLRAIVYTHLQAREGSVAAYNPHLRLKGFADSRRDRLHARSHVRLGVPASDQRRTGRRLRGPRARASADGHRSRPRPAAVSAPQAFGDGSASSSRCAAEPALQPPGRPAPRARGPAHRDDPASPIGAHRPGGTRGETWLPARTPRGSLYGPNLATEVLRYAAGPATIARRERFDVIHAHDWMTFPAGLEARRVSGRPLVVHVHATEYRSRRRRGEIRSCATSSAGACARRRPRHRRLALHRRRARPATTAFRAAGCGSSTTPSIGEPPDTGRGTDRPEPPGALRRPRDAAEGSRVLPRGGGPRRPGGPRGPVRRGRLRATVSRPCANAPSPSASDAASLSPGSCRPTSSTASTRAPTST